MPAKNTPPFSQQERSLALAIAIYLLLLQALFAVWLSTRSSAESSVDALAVNAAGRQRMLSQHLANSLLELGRIQNHQLEAALPYQQELKRSYEQFDQALAELSQNTVVDRGGMSFAIESTKSLRARSLINRAYSLWAPIQIALRPLLASPAHYSKAELDDAIATVSRSSQQLLILMNDLTNEIEDAAHQKAERFENFQALAALLILANFGFVLFFFRRQLNQLAERKSVLNRMMEHLGTALIVMDQKRKIDSANRSAEKLFGYGTGELVGMNLTDLLNESAYPVTGKHKDGQQLSLDLTITEIPGMKHPLFIASLSDTSAQRIQEAKLQHLAYHDPLTALPNRMLFMDRLDQAIARAHRHHDMIAVLFIDLDRFKPVNDELGHATGDLLLQQVAKRLIGCMREEDTIARLGGDEFTMIIDANDANNCDIVARKILDELGRAFFLNNHTIRISASIGLSVYPRDGSDITSLVDCADAAMYCAKEHGGNSYCRYADMHGKQPGVQA